MELDLTFVSLSAVLAATFAYPWALERHAERLGAKTKPRVMFALIRLGFSSTVLNGLSRGLDLSGATEPTVALLVSGVGTSLLHAALLIYAHSTIATAAAAAARGRMLASRSSFFAALWVLLFLLSTTRSVLTIIRNEKRWDAWWQLSFSVLIGVVWLRITLAFSEIRASIGRLNSANVRVDRAASAMRRLRIVQLVTTAFFFGGLYAQLTIFIRGYKSTEPNNDLAGHFFLRWLILAANSWMWIMATMNARSFVALTASEAAMRTAPKSVSAQSPRSRASDRVFAVGGPSLREPRSTQPARPFFSPEAWIEPPSAIAPDLAPSTPRAMAIVVVPPSG
jgi:hypothetical protein